MARKKFYQIKTEILNSNIPLYVESLEEAEGKVIKLDTTRILKGKSSESKLKILKDKDGNLVAKFFNFKILPFYMKRVVRKGTNYVEDSFLVEVKNAQLRVKPFLLTRKKVHRSVRKALRNKAKELIFDFFKTKTREQVFNSIFRGEIQKYLNTKLRKIYPLAFCDIRVIEVKKTFKFKKEEPEKKEIKVEKIK